MRVVRVAAASALGRLGAAAATAVPQLTPCRPLPEGLRSPERDGKREASVAL